MFIETHDNLTFSFKRGDKGYEDGSLLTIWTGESGYIEVYLNNKELEKLKEILK